MNYLDGYFKFLLKGNNIMFFLYEDKVHYTSKINDTELIFAYELSKRFLVDKKIDSTLLFLNEMDNTVLIRRDLEKILYYAIRSI